jgi:hypothetical protein
MSVGCLAIWLFDELPGAGRGRLRGTGDEGASDETVLGAAELHCASCALLNCALA